MATETEAEREEKRLQPVMVVSTFGGTILVLIGVVGAVLSGTDGTVAGLGRTPVLDGIHVLSGIAVVGSAAYRDGDYANLVASIVGGGLMLLTVGALVLPDSIGASFQLSLLTTGVHLVLASILLGVGLLFRQPEF